MSTTVELGRMRDQRDAAVAELDKLRAAVEALAEMWAEAGFDDESADLYRLLDADS